MISSRTFVLFFFFGKLHSLALSPKHFSINVSFLILCFDLGLFVGGPKSFSMSRTTVWMFWWSICPMLKVTSREYRQDVKTLLEHTVQCNYLSPLMFLLYYIKLCRFEVENVENGGTLSDKGKPAERSMEDLTKSSSSSHSHGMSRAARALTVR